MVKQSTVSTWLLRLKGQPDDLSAQKLWDRISPRMQVLSRRLLQRFGTDASFDEDDITVTVFASLCSGLHTEQFPDLRDSEGLWKLLTLMTVRKVNDHAKIRRARKRNGGIDQQRQAMDIIDRCPATEPEPQMEVMMADECRRMLAQLNDPVLERIVLLKLHGYTNEEIADLLQYSRRTIQRMLNLVRDVWSHHVGQ